MHRHLFLELTACRTVTSFIKKSVECCPEASVIQEHIDFFCGFVLAGGNAASFSFSSSGECTIDFNLVRIPATFLGAFTATNSFSLCSLARSDA
mmetsp:Transcript_17782/g.25000  ORF Transcript_17782/g.25000 Transcript_17782/m.25000 type:complete len:94 (-) Transcript_17782:610-891(-)